MLVRGGLEFTRVAKSRIIHFLFRWAGALGSGAVGFVIVICYGETDRQTNRNRRADI